MKKSDFKKSESKIRSKAKFTKNDEHVPEFSDTNSRDDEMLKRATADLYELFTGLRHSGISGEELYLSLEERGDKLSVFISRSDDTPLSISETNLICRLSTSSGLTARVSNGGIEIIAASPKFKDTKLYARVLMLLRRELSAEIE